MKINSNSVPKRNHGCLFHGSNQIREGTGQWLLSTTTFKLCAVGTKQRTRKFKEDKKSYERRKINKTHFHTRQSITK